MPPNESRVVNGKAGQLHALENAGFRIPRFVVLSADRDDSIDSDLNDIIAEVGFPLAVRSSASVEDGATHSFAGQFESYLNLTSRTQVVDAITRCRESVRSLSVAQYCRTTGTVAGRIKMDVIIQRMVQAQISGVAFTVNPVSGKEEVVIDAVEGIGGDLLAGRISALENDATIVERYREEVAATAESIAEHFGCPQDVEFAVEGGLVWVLQSRPVTRITTTGISGEWTNANFREGGVSTTVCSPLMWSLYSRIWDSSLRQALRQIRLFSGDFAPSRMFFGRPYWNLGAVKECLAKVPGFVEREFDVDLGIEITYEGDGIRTPVTAKTLLRFLPAVFAIRRFIKLQTAEANDLLNGEFDQIHRRYDALGDAIADFRRLIEQDYCRFESSYFRTIYALSFAKLEFRFLFPNADFSALMLNLQDIRHTAPIRRFEQMAQQQNCDPAVLLKDFGYHYHVGLDIRHPRWDEDPEFIERLSQLPKCNGGDLSGAYEESLAVALSMSPIWKRPLFRNKLARLRNLVWIREEMRDCSNRLYHLIRNRVLEISALRNLGDDIFFMTYEEILDDDRTHIDERRSVFNRFRNFSPPHEIGRAVKPRNDVVPDARSGTTLCGLSACPGRVRGTARTGLTAKDAMQLPENVILVCPHTDPGWTPALSRAAGVITESGGILSHAAVICREFQLPAVLSVPNACERIPDGCTVELDGGTGEIRLLD